MLQDKGGIGDGSTREGSALKRMDEGAYRCLGREAGGYHSLKDHRERLKEDDNPKGGGRVVGGFTWLVEDDTKCFFEGGRVKTVREQGVQEGWKKGGLEAVDRFPHRVEDVIGARGRGVRGFGEGPGYLFRG